MLPAALVHEIRFGFEVTRLGHRQFEGPTACFFAHWQIAPCGSAHGQALRMRLKDFAPQRIRPSQSRAQESAPALCRGPAATVLHPKSHMIADESQQSFARRGCHHWNQWLHVSLPRDSSETCRVRTKKLALRTDFVRVDKEQSRLSCKNETEVSAVGRKKPFLNRRLPRKSQIC